MNQICKTFFYILRLPCDKTSGSPQQWGVQPDHGLPSTFLPRAFPTHTLVIISIIYLHNVFIIVRIILDVIIIIVRVTMNNGNSRSPLRWVGASGCFFLSTFERRDWRKPISPCVLPPAGHPHRITSVKFEVVKSSLKFTKELLMLSWKSFHWRHSFSDMLMLQSWSEIWHKETRDSLKSLWRG